MTCPVRDNLNGSANLLDRTKLPSGKAAYSEEMRKWYRNMLNMLVGIVISRILCTIRLVIVLSSVTFYLLHFVLCVQITIPIKEACLLYRGEGQIQSISSK